MRITRKSRGKVQHGNVGLAPDEFHPRNVKIRVTMMVDQEIADAFRAAAVKCGIGYQTLMNEKLRESLPGLDKTLADRVADAKARAQQIAQNTGSSVGSVRTARMGVLQITPADSNEVSDSGMNDTTSLWKDITAVVNIGFAVS